MAAQYSFVMKDMTEDLPRRPEAGASTTSTCSSYQGAKIGIVGPNGAGKSTLMKIMAGIDTEFTGEAWPGEYITVGYLAQEPRARSDQDRARERQGRRARNRGPRRPLQRDRRMLMGDPPDDADFDALMEPRWASCRRRSTRSTAGRSTTSSRSRWKRCAARRATGRSRTSRAARSAASRSTRLLIQKPVDPAARRADQPPRRRERRVAGEPPQGTMPARC